MFNVNEYFAGKVKSLSFQSDENKATLGVIASGEYEFGTSSIEYMTLITGRMDVLLPQSSQWKTYHKGETFMIDKNQKFKIKVQQDTAYICEYK